MTKPMRDYIEAARDLLCTVWGDPKASEIRTHLQQRLPTWTPEEHEELLTLAASLAWWHTEGARDALGAAERHGREIEGASGKTSKGLGRFRLREADKRENERRAAVPERHFGDALRGSPATGEGGR